MIVPYAYSGSSIDIYIMYTKPLRQHVSLIATSSVLVQDIDVTQGRWRQAMDLIGSLFHIFAEFDFKLY